LIILFLPFAGPAQDPARFEKEVTSLVAGDSAIHNKRIILFTGSSSIRLWTGLKDYFPEKNVLNRGFGGSEMSDLLYYFDQLVKPYKARKIFIYEGDNDLNSGVAPELILANAERLLSKIRSVSKKTKVYFISPKPSLARWQMKDKYKAFNGSLQAWTSTKKNVYFIDMWAPLTDQNGEVLNDIFIEDKLHLNEKGYDIWSAVISKYVD